MLVHLSLNSDAVEVRRFTQQELGNILLNEVIANTVIHTRVDCMQEVDIAGNRNKLDLRNERESKTIENETYHQGSYLMHSRYPS